MPRQSTKKGGSSEKRKSEKLHDRGLRAGDDETKAKLFAEAAELGHCVAASRLAEMLIAGRPRRDEEEAVRFLEMAREGVPAADHNLGIMYLEGRGVAKSEAKAAEYWRRAVERGWTKSAHSLGTLYFDGRGVPRDVTKASELFLTSDNEMAGERLCRCGRVFEDGDCDHPKDVAKALALYEAAATKKDDPDGWRALGACHELTLGDVEAAVPFFLKAAEAGDVGSQIIVAGHYEYGHGVPRDVTVARHWYQAAADAGEPQAMWCLALLDEDGSGLHKSDFLRAATLYYAAADRGHEDASDEIRRALDAFQSDLHSHDDDETNKIKVLAACLKRKARSCAYCGKAPENGKWKKCQRCRRARYCSPACQKMDWSDHRDFCHRPMTVGVANESRP